MQSRTIVAFGRAFAVILACTFAGQWIASLLPFAFPGSIIGMALLFAALATGLVKPAWIECGAELLLRYMALMFVPLGVGLVAYLGVLETGAVPFLLSTIASTLVTMLVVGFVFEKAAR